VGLCPTPCPLLKKGDENFSRMGVRKLYVILSRVNATRRKESELSLSAVWLAALSSSCMARRTKMTWKSLAIKFLQTL